MIKVSQYNQAISSQLIAAKANREDTVIKPSVLRQWQPQPIEIHYNQIISTRAMATKANREVNIIKPSILKHWQPKPTEKVPFR